MKRLSILLLCFVAVGIGYWHIAQRPAEADFSIPVFTSPAQHNTPSKIVKSIFLPSTGAAKVHAASLILLKNGNVMAFWFEGSREGAKDVVIQRAILNTQTQTWDAPKLVIDRETTQQGLARYISRLGNPVPTRTAHGQLQLFFVTTSIGGWATSSITTITSSDEGETWSRPQRVITSPFFNLSTLVKSPAISFADGRLGLPVYHELFGKFGELLRIDSTVSTKQLLDKYRLSSGRATLQPVIFIEDAKDATAYFRQARIHDTDPKRIPTSDTVDAGQTWQTGADLTIANPNAAIAGLTLANGDRLLVANDLEKGRYRLIIFISRRQFIDNHPQYSAWELATILEDDSELPIKERRRFSYPYLILDQANNVHLVYSFDSNRIKHVYFSADYFNQQVAP